MKARALARVGAIGAACAVIIAGLSAAPAAMADPAATPAVSSTTLAGFGSDTTQDVMNEIAKSVNTAKSAAWIASYDALGDTTVIAKPGGVAIPRANGSGDGFKLLQVAKGVLGSSAIVSGTTKTSLTVTTSQASGQVDFARSSSNGTSTDANAAGVWAYVPFAKDAVTIATNPKTTADPTAALDGNIALGTAKTAATDPTLYNIYHCVTKYVYTKADNSYVGVGAAATPLPATATKATLLKPVLPAFGSGTRKYFVGLFGYTDSASLIDPNSEDTSCLTDKSGGQGINEHDGTAIKAIGPGALGAFSIPQWVTQAKSATTGVTDRRYGVVLMGMKTALSDAAGVPATTGSGDTVATNASFPVKRIMYNVVPYGKLADNTTREYAVFAGKDSEVCKATASITKMGFILLNNAVSPASTEDCGYIQNRFNPTSLKAPATITAEFAQVKSGDSVDLLLQTNNLAGNALFYSSADTYATAISDPAVAIGADDLVASFTTTVSGSAGSSVSFKGQFTPTDTSIFAASDKTSTAVKVTIVDPYTVTLNDIPSRVAPGSTVNITATVAAGTGATLVGGNLNLVDGSGNVLAEKYLPKRAKTADFTWTAVAGTTSLAVVFEPDNSSASLVKTSDAQDVYVAAANTLATVTTVRGFAYKAGYFGKVAVSSAAGPQLKVALTASGTLKPTGTVRVLISTSKTGGTALTLVPALVGADGTVTITLPATNKWRVTGTSSGVDRYLNVIYSGDSNFYGLTKSYKVSITQ